ncbi:MAG: diacylglycerol kinase [Acidiferrobacterales bacterium]|nr:diacylglycerol kinase [Acidiferrobacterales bacterium]
MSRLMRNQQELIDAIKNSLQGFVIVWRGEVAFRQYVVLSVLLIPLALWLGENNVERVLLIVSVLLVLLMELVNTAIEAVVDRIGSEQHELSGAAKDIGSAAVFLSIVTFVITWLLILLG